MLLKMYCVLAILALSFGNAKAKVYIKWGDKDITSYTEPLNNDKTTFECVTDESNPTHFAWSIGDVEETSGINSFLTKKLELEHYKKKLKCEVTFEGDTTNWAGVELLMKCKLF